MPPISDALPAALLSGSRNGATTTLPRSPATTLMVRSAVVRSALVVPALACR